MKLLRWWLICFAALLLAACAQMPEAPEAARALGPPLAQFTAEGRLSLRQGERRDHLRFRWERSPGSDAVLLMSPLGQGLAELTRDARGARLVQPKQTTIVADSLRQLAQHVFGAPLPLEAMADWLRGAQPALSGVVDGWRVVVSDTSTVRQSQLLRVMEASREDVELKLIVDAWDVPE